MKVAHISDLHLLALAGLTARRLANKRVTGWVNLKLRRQAHHHDHTAEAVARAIRARGDVDHVVVTGDVSNLALESEFERVRSYLLDEFGPRTEQLSIIPGNHDAYTRGAYRSRRFEQAFAPYLQSDLPGASGVAGLGAYPYVQLRGPLAFIGLSSAVPRPPLVASGRVGKLQRLALHSLLGHEEVRARTPVILVHHPWHNPSSAAKTWLGGLEDARELGETLAQLEHGVLLHGHLHRRIRRVLPTASGQLEAIGATSASLVHDDENRMGGYNLYSFDDVTGRLTRAEAFRLEPANGSFVPVEIPSA
ncbi:MAG: metallophosphoesterase [Myxococcales bacterium]|nr:metallophosphoesterase [Myxococcales bacterium]